MINRIKELLLEFDPKNVLILGRERSAHRAKNKELIASFNRERPGTSIKKNVDRAEKAGNRALSRGGEDKMRTQLGKMRGPKRKLPEALEQALLEFDPRKDTAKNRQGFAGRDRERSASGKRIVRKSIATQQSTEKARKKSANRAGSRSIGLGDKLGRKRKFSEATQQALLEFDPNKEQDLSKPASPQSKSSGRAGRQELERVNKVKNGKTNLSKVMFRALARGAGDVLGSPKNKLIRKDTARDIRGINKRIKAKLGN